MKDAIQEHVVSQENTHPTYEVYFAVTSFKRNARMEAERSGKIWIIWSKWPISQDCKQGSMNEEHSCSKYANTYKTGSMRVPGSSTL